MNRSTGMNKANRKRDPRMPFSVDAGDVQTGYISPQMHKNLKQLSAKRKKVAA